MNMDTPKHKSLLEWTIYDGTLPTRPNTDATIIRARQGIQGTSIISPSADRIVSSKLAHGDAWCYLPSNPLDAQGNFICDLDDFICDQNDLNFLFHYDAYESSDTDKDWPIPFQDHDQTKVVYFRRMDGRYVADDGMEITVDMLMHHTHEIRYDEGWIVFEDADIK